MIKENIEEWTFDLVQERLVEAMLLWRRMPDRERGWLVVRAYWPEMRRHHHFGDYADVEASPRALPLSRDEVGRMEEASAWLMLVGERDRALVALAVSWLASGRAQVPWRRLLKPLGISFGSDGLRMRYGRAIRAIAVELERRQVVMV